MRRRERRIRMTRLAAVVGVLALLPLLSGESELQCQPVPVEPADCVEAGGTVPVVPDAPQCCPGLEPASVYDVVDGECLPLVGGAVCIACGDGVCGPGEDACNCPEDCEDGPACVPEGETFPIVPDHLPCCTGLVAVGCDAPAPDGSCLACDGASYCTACGDGVCGLGENVCRCPEDCGGDCVPEGESYAVVPGHPECCPGLSSVGCAEPTADGTCMPCAGGSFCTACGDGVCGPAENVCRCPEDCDAVWF